MARYVLESKIYIIDILNQINIIQPSIILTSLSYHQQIIIITQLSTLNVCHYPSFSTPVLDKTDPNSQILMSQVCMDSNSVINWKNPISEEDPWGGGSC